MACPWLAFEPPCCRTSFSCDEMGTSRCIWPGTKQKQAFTTSEAAEQIEPERLEWDEIQVRVRARAHIWPRRAKTTCSQVAKKGILHRHRPTVQLFFCPGVKDNVVMPLQTEPYEEFSATATTLPLKQFREEQALLCDLGPDS